MLFTYTENFQISGSIVTLGWYASALFTLLLAINRFVQMIYAEYVDEVFSAMKLKVVGCELYILIFIYLDLLSHLLVNLCTDADYLLDTVHFATIFTIFRLVLGTFEFLI